MDKIKLIELGYSFWNGITFELLAIETWKFEATLLGFNIGKGFFNFDMLFFHFEVMSPKY